MFCLQGSSDYGRPKKSKSKASTSSKSKSKKKKKNKRARVMYDSHLEDESEEDEVRGLKISLKLIVSWECFVALHRLKVNGNFRFGQNIS